MADHIPMLTFFTPNEANSLLPDVQRILHDLLLKKRQAAEEKARMEPLSGLGRSPVQDSVRQRMQLLMDEIERGVLLLEEMGCIVRHIDEGIVDFPAMRYGKQVYLCWRIGESKVSFWHDMTSGFAGRAPITEAEIAKAYV